MAVTLKMTKKVSRLNLIRTIASHGWTIEGVLQDDNRKKYNDIIHAKIKAYVIHSSFADGQLIAIYQPEMNEITVIAESSETENRFKNKIGHILESNKLGVLIEKSPKLYVDNLLNHNVWLTDEELTSLINDAHAKNESNSFYIA